MHKVFAQGIYATHPLRVSHRVSNNHNDDNNPILIRWLAHQWSGQSTDGPRHQYMYQPMYKWDNWGNQCFIVIKKRQSRKLNGKSPRGKPSVGECSCACLWALLTGFHPSSTS